MRTLSDSDTRGGLKMQIMLTAFSGKLKSEVMDWPEEAGNTVHLALPVDVRPYLAPTLTQMLTPPAEMRTRICTFQWRGKYLDGGRVRIYVLEDVA